MGGVLVGRYSDDLTTALISEAVGPPEGSSSGHTWFRRGIGELQAKFDELWKSGIYYLGEWHSHPFSDAEPSRRDKYEMSSIALTTSSRCPEPILLIVGGNPSENWDMRAFIYITGRGLVELSQWTAPGSGS